MNFGTLKIESNSLSFWLCIVALTCCCLESGAVVHGAIEMPRKDLSKELTDFSSCVNVQKLAKNSDSLDK